MGNLIPGDIGRLDNSDSLRTDDEIVFRRLDDVRSRQGSLFSANASLFGNFNKTIDIVDGNPYNASPSNEVLLVDASAEPITINLFTAVGNRGKELTIKKIDSVANDVTIDGSGSETIDGDLTKVINSPNVSYTIVSDDTNWVIL